MLQGFVRDCWNLLCAVSTGAGADPISAPLLALASTIRPWAHSAVDLFSNKTFLMEGVKPRTPLKVSARHRVIVYVGSAAVCMQLAHTVITVAIDDVLRDGVVMLSVLGIVKGHQLMTLLHCVSLAPTLGLLCLFRNSSWV